MLTQLTPEAFDSPAWPRTYGVSLGWKLILVPLGVLFAAAGVGGFVFLASSAHDLGLQTWATLFASAITLGFAGLGVYIVASALKYRVVLAEDGVELLQPFRSRRLSRAEIQGHRTLRPQQGPRILVLVPRNPAVRKLKISRILKTDPTFDAWVAGLQDLDRHELQQSEQGIAETLHQHLMPHESKARVRQHRIFARCVNWAAIILAFAAFILPDHHHLLIGIVIAVPWITIGLVAALQPLYRFGGKRNDAHPDLSQALLIPGLLLMGRVLTDAHALDWSGPLALAVGGALLLSGAALWADPWLRRQRSSALLICACTLLYGFGAGFEIDVLADSSKPGIYATQVLGKRVNHGSKSTTYYLAVGAWRPNRRNEEISVPVTRFDATSIGDTVCIYAGKGALRVAWYELRDCPASK